MTNTRFTYMIYIYDLHIYIIYICSILFLFLNYLDTQTLQKITAGDK